MKRFLIALALVVSFGCSGSDTVSGPPVTTPTAIPSPTATPACVEGQHTVIGGQCYVCNGGTWTTFLCPTPVATATPTPAPACHEGDTRTDGVGGPNGPVCELCSAGQWKVVACSEPCPLILPQCVPTPTPTPSCQVSPLPPGCH